MKLADLAAGAGLSLAQLAAAVSVQPLLLARMDEGVQPMTRSLAALIAGVVKTQMADVLASCPLTTRLDGPKFYKPLPPQLGELFTPARLSYGNQKVPAIQVGPLWIVSVIAEPWLLTDPNYPHIDIYEGTDPSWEHDGTALPYNPLVDEYSYQGQIFVRATDTEVWMLCIVLEGAGNAIFRLRRDNGIVLGMSVLDSENFVAIVNQPPDPTVWLLGTDRAWRYSTSTQTRVAEVLTGVTGALTMGIFVQGQLYGLYNAGYVDPGDTLSSGIVQIDPNSNMVIKSTPNPDQPTGPARFCYSQNADSFYIARGQFGPALVINDFLVADRATLTLASVPLLETLANVAMHETIALCSTDVFQVGGQPNLWMIAFESIDGGDVQQYRLLEVPPTGGNAVGSYHALGPDGVTESLMVNGIAHGDFLYILLYDPKAYNFVNAIFDTNQKKFVGFVLTPDRDPVENPVGLSFV